MRESTKPSSSPQVWYGGPGQHEHLRDVEAGLLRGDSGEREEDEHEEVWVVMLVVVIMIMIMIM